MRERGPGRLPRLRGYDYSSSGVDFVTICSWRRRPIFCRASRGGLWLTPVGHVLHEEWVTSLELRPTFRRDAFVVMPDHFHALVGISAGAEPTPESAHLRRMPLSLSSLIACFKASCTRRINLLRRTPHAPVWQARFHDRVVRNDRELLGIRWYIQDNPRRLLVKLGLSAPS